MILYREPRKGPLTRKAQSAPNWRYHEPFRRPHAVCTVFLAPLLWQRRPRGRRFQHSPGRNGPSSSSCHLGRAARPISTRGCSPIGSHPMGQVVVVDNRPGGDGLVAIGSFVGANDDHTLLFASPGRSPSSLSEHEKLPYDAGLDILPIAMCCGRGARDLVPDHLGRPVVPRTCGIARVHGPAAYAAAAQGLSDFMLSGFLPSSRAQMARISYRDILQAPTISRRGASSAMTLLESCCR